MDKENIYEIISEVTEFNDISDFMKDSDLDESLAIVIKLIGKPDVPIKVATDLVVQLQAMSVKFKMQAKYYMLYEKSPESMKKKNTYLSMSESLERLVDSLKYVIRNG